MVNYMVIPGIKIEDRSNMFSDKLFNILYTEFGISKAKLIEKNNKTEICMYRHLFCYFMVKHSRQSLKTIGNHLGGRNHATILNSTRNITDWLSINDYTIVEIHNKINKLLCK